MSKEAVSTALNGAHEEADVLEDGLDQGRSSGEMLMECVVKVCSMLMSAYFVKACPDIHLYALVAAAHASYSVFTCLIKFLHASSSFALDQPGTVYAQRGVPTPSSPT